jgi:hypothetical protein
MGEGIFETMTTLWYLIAGAKSRHISVLTGLIVLIAFSSAIVIGLFTADAAAHLDDNLIGVPPSDISEWNYHGISQGESKRWIEEGIIFAAWAAQWQGEGFSAESAGKWHKIANVYTAGDFLKNGFGPEEAGEWMNHGIKSGLRAREYLSAGLDALEAGTFWKKGLYPEEAKEWKNAGFNAEAMLEWRYGPRMSEFYFTKDSIYSQTVYDVGFAMSWRNAGFTAEEAHLAGTYQFELTEARKWKDAGFSFKEMVRWKDSGFTLEKAVASRGASLSAIDAELKQYDSSVKEDEVSKLSADITVKHDGTLDVIETITIIDRPGGDYREGYYRYAPALECKLSSSGMLYAAPRLRVKSVELDHAPGDHELRDNVLYFKKNGTPLPEGKHRITLSYTTDSMVLDGPHHDELCFVIVGGIGKGNYIRNASATVRLPKGGHVIFANGNAGLRDRKDIISEIEETEQGDIVRYSVTRPLRQDMAFSVNIGFVKGYAKASWLQKLILLDRKSRRFLSSLLIFVSGLTVCFVYYWAAWSRVGRDPKGRGVAAAEFSPPGDIGPAGMRALMGKGKTDHLSTAAELLSLAKRGSIRILESEGTYKIEKMQTLLDQLPDWEKGFLAMLFQERNIVVLTGLSERKQLSRASQRLKSSLKSEYRKHTRQNMRYLWPGIIISALFLGASLAIIDKGELFDRGNAGAVMTGYAAVLAASFGLLTSLFARLLRQPTKEYVDLLERLHAYVNFLRRNFADLNARVYIPPFLQKHLPYAIAAGIDVDGLLIRSGETKWYKGASGDFECGDFILTVKRSL